MQLVQLHRVGMAWRGFAQHWWQHVGDGGRGGALQLLGRWGIGGGQGGCGGWLRYEGQDACCTHCLLNHGESALALGDTQLSDKMLLCMRCHLCWGACWDIVAGNEAPVALANLGRAGWNRLGSSSWRRTARVVLRGGCV